MTFEQCLSGMFQVFISAICIPSITFIHSQITYKIFFLKPNIWAYRIPKYTLCMTIWRLTIRTLQLSVRLRRSKSENKTKQNKTDIHQRYQTSYTTPGNGSSAMGLNLGYKYAHDLRVTRDCLHAQTAVHAGKRI